MNDLYSLLLQQGYSEQDIQDLMGLGPMAEEEGRLATQMELARELKDTQGPEGRQAGRTYVAANPLEHLAAGLNQFRGRQEIGDTRARQAELAQEQAALRARLFRGGGGAQMSPVTPQTQPLPPQLQGMGIV